MNTSKKLVLGIVAVVIVAVSGWVYFSKKISVDRQESEAASSNIYIAQSAAGSADGSSCANARAASFFNSSGNWGTGTTQIGSGTVVHLCGTITTDFTSQGSGASGNPVVVDGTGATMSGVGFTVTKNYLTLQNIRFPNGAGVFIGGGSMPHDIIIRNNYFKNQCTSARGDVIGTEGSYNVLIEGNYMENCATNDVNHDDLIQTWAAGGNSALAPHDWTIRYNYFVMNTPSEFNKSFHMLEGLTGPVNIYGNVYDGRRGGGSANGVNMNSNQSGMVANIYGNTVVQKSGGPNNLWNLKGSGQWNLRNNITYATGAGNTLTGDAVGTSRMTRQNNLWFGPGSPSCVTTEICQNPQFKNLTGNDFSLAAGSPALGKGTTLGAPYTTAVLQGATWPNPTLATRPAGAWDMGAFINSGGTGGGGTTGSSDLNSDGKVDVVDLGILLSSWGQTTKPKADINQDAKVDVVDLGILLGKWGTSG